MELGIACGGGSICDGIGDGVKAVDNSDGWCDSQSTVLEMWRDLVFGINDAVAVVMLKGDANIESIRAAEVPGAASGWLSCG
jgi:hypothetical protein